MKGSLSAQHWYGNCRVTDTWQFASAWEQRKLELLQNIKKSLFDEMIVGEW